MIATYMVVRPNGTLEYHAHDGDVTSHQERFMLACRVDHAVREGARAIYVTIGLAPYSAWADRGLIPWSPGLGFAKHIVSHLTALVAQQRGGAVPGWLYPVSLANAWRRALGEAVPIDLPWIAEKGKLA